MTITHKSFITFSISLGMLLGLSIAVAPEASAQQVCAKAIQRLEQFGKGDKDHDGLTKCEEKKVTFTDPKDWDTDRDGLADGEELAGNTDPLTTDTDADGLSDGEEAAAGTSAIDPDSDNDGILDGVDPDPASAISDKIEGSVESLVCPAATTDGLLVVLGNSIVLTPTTSYDGAETCESLQQRMVDFGGAHVEVRVSDDGFGGLIAERVDLEDADNDGSPDNIDLDDDNDGIEDSIDTDDDNDGVSDIDDNDDSAGIDEDGDDNLYEDDNADSDVSSTDGDDNGTGNDNGTDNDNGVGDDNGISEAGNGASTDDNGTSSDHDGIGDDNGTDSDDNGADDLQGDSDFS